MRPLESAIPSRSTSSVPSTIHPIRSAFYVQLHQNTTFKLSTDLQFVDELHDIGGLQMDPSENASDTCVNASSQVRALHRVQPRRRTSPYGSRLTMSATALLLASGHSIPRRGK